MGKPKHAKAGQISDQKINVRDVGKTYLEVLRSITDDAELLRTAERNQQQHEQGDPAANHDCETSG